MGIIIHGNMMKMFIYVDYIKIKYSRDTYVGDRKLNWSLNSSWYNIMFLLV